MEAAKAQVQDTMSSGVRKAAALMLMLGEDVARDILPILSNAEIQNLSTGTGALQDLEAEEVIEILREYNESLEDAVLFVDEGEGAFRRLAEETLGKDRARAVLDRPSLALSSSFIDLCTRIEADALAKILEKEHPQTVAVILSGLPPAQAGPILGSIVEDRRAEILRRISTLKAVSNDVLQQAEESLRAEIMASIADGQIKVDGSTLAISIIKEVGDGRDQEILEALETDAPELAADIRRKMFIFDDLVELGVRDVQTLLREVPTSVLRVALRSAPPSLSEKIFANMSQRAAMILREDIDAQGPVPLDQVEEARESVVQTALELARTGKLTMPGQGGSNAMV